MHVCSYTRSAGPGGGGGGGVQGGELGQGATLHSWGSCSWGFHVCTLRVRQCGEVAARGLGERESGGPA